MDVDGDRRQDRPRPAWANPHDPHAAADSDPVSIPHHALRHRPDPEIEARDELLKAAIRELSSDGELFTLVQDLTDASQMLRGRMMQFAQNNGGIEVAGGQLLMRTYSGSDDPPALRIERLDKNRLDLIESVSSTLALARSVSERARSPYLKQAAAEFEYLDCSTFEAVLHQKGVRVGARYLLPSEQGAEAGESHMHCELRHEIPSFVLSATAGVGAAVAVGYFFATDLFGFLVTGAATAYMAYKGLFSDWAKHGLYEEMGRPYAARLSSESNAILDWVENTRNRLVASIDPSH